jgi:hypothetical protein
MTLKKIQYFQPTLKLFPKRCRASAARRTQIGISATGEDRESAGSDLDVELDIGYLGLIGRTI